MDPKDARFFAAIRLTLDDIADDLPYSQVSRYLADATYDAADIRLETGCDQTSPLGQLLDIDAIHPETRLGHIKTLARQLDRQLLDCAPGDLTPQLAQALLEVARQCGDTTLEDSVLVRLAAPTE